MEDSIVIQSKISREDFDGFVNLLRLIGQRQTKRVSDKEEVERLWTAMKQAPCDLAEIPDEDINEDTSREQVQFVMFSFAVQVGIARMKKGDEDGLA